MRANFLNSKKPSTLSKSKRGQAIAEYLILTALIAIGSMGVIQILGSNIKNKLAVISEAIRGEKRNWKGTEAQERHYKVRDMGSFQEAFDDEN